MLEMKRSWAMILVKEKCNILHCRPSDLETQETFNGKGPKVRLSQLHRKFPNSYGELRNGDTSPLRTRRYLVNKVEGLSDRTWWRWRRYKCYVRCKIGGTSTYIDFREMATMWLCNIFLSLLMICGIYGGQTFVAQALQQAVPENDKLNLEAITRIHSHLDDDRNGKVDFSESTEFMRDELHMTDEERHSHFHGNNNYISVDEMWQIWVESEVYNWTNKDVVDWLINSVHLPQYADVFTSIGINGTVIPRLATEENGLLQNELGVRDPKHRKKISLRAMDIVLFGPPFVSGHNLIKDVVVAFSVLVATVGCWMAVLQKRKAKEQMERMIKDMKILQQAEDGLQELQTRLSQAEKDHQAALMEKLDLEARLREELLMSQNETQMLSETYAGTEENMQRLKVAEEELAQVRRALRKAEKELEYQSWRAPSVLKQWLQMTFEKETKHFHHKRSVALKQMQEAKEACERIKKKRTSMMGSLRLAHDLSIDEVDQKILSARSALAEVTNELEERQHRWSQIESLCGFQIMSQNSFGITSTGTRNRTSSAIAQALVNVANVAGVSSGRKISSSARPCVTSSAENTLYYDKDLPPTYSTVATNIAVKSGDSKEFPKHHQNVQDVVQENVSQGVLSAKNCSANNCHNSNCNDIGIEDDRQAASCSAEKVEPENTVKYTEQVIDAEAINDGAATFESPTGKSKKRLSWFGKKQDSLSESESSSTTENDEETRKKIKWLWKSAVRKAKTQRQSPSKADNSDTTSLEKLKSG